MNLDIYKLACTSKGHPYVLSGALPIGYFERFFCGRALPEDWQPPPHSIHGIRNKRADIISWKEALPLLSQRAVDVFESVAPGCAEYKFFTEIRGEPFFVINVLTTEEPLALMSAAGSNCAPDGAMTIKPCVAPLFKLRGRFHEPAFVRRAIPEAVVASELIGFQFRDPFASETRALFYDEDVNVFPGVRR